MNMSAHKHKTDNSIPLIEINDATVVRGENTIFDGLNLTLAQNESVAILGP
ncbi:MAG: molybdenum ABC transporter ATP-binding protein, partial [Proteobacteria bacterium]|nr:molybdenum ABC transporter ATP-binding protein [Pseudomonadota bacterium]